MLRGHQCVQILAVMIPSFTAKEQSARRNICLARAAETTRGSSVHPSYSASGGSQASEKVRSLTKTTWVAKPGTELLTPHPRAPSDDCFSPPGADGGRSTSHPADCCPSPWCRLPGEAHFPLCSLCPNPLKAHRVVPPYP